MCCVGGTGRFLRIKMNEKFLKGAIEHEETLGPAARIYDAVYLC